MSSPWKTLQSGVSHLLPGDTLNVQPGKYTGFIVGWDPPGAGIYGAIAGTAAQPITIQADPSAAPGSVIINARGTNKTATGIDLEPGCDYITLSGFTITNEDGSITKDGIKVNGINDKIIGNTVTGVGGFGIFVDNATNVVIQGNTVSGTTGTGNLGHGVYVSGSTDHAVVVGNRIHDNSYIGLHFNGDVSEGGLGLVTNALVSGNIIYNNGQNAINADGLQDSVIENNLIYNFQGFGICLYRIDASAGSSNNIIVNNTIYYGTSTSAGAAIRIKDQSTSNTISNNIMLGGGGIALRIGNDSLSGLVSDYNVVGSLFQSEDTSATQTLSQWKSQTGQDSKSFTATPAQLFVNAANNDFQELSTSPSIDAGTALNAPGVDIVNVPRPQGRAYDIGAYEYQTGVLAPPIVVGQSPAAGATGIPITSVVSVTFNQSIQQNTVVFTLGNSAGISVPATFSYNSSTNTATLTPSTTLDPLTVYTATVSGAQNQTGQGLASPFIWSFTTGSNAVIPTVTSKSPAANATNVAISSVISATFNETVVPSTISFVVTGVSTIPGTVNYSNATNTVTWTPLSSLSPSTTYTVTVSGAKDVSGNTMASPVTWSFTTSSSVGAGPFTIWNDNATPQIANEDDNQAVEVGVQFYSDVSGTITGLKFYKGSSNTGTHVADLWTSAGVLMATATYTSESASGWQYVSFATPVPITAGTMYVASYHTNVGYYSVDLNYFGSPYKSGPLHVPTNGGVYAYGAAGSFPNQTFIGSNYWVDPVLSTSNSTPPTVVSETPSPLSTNIAVSTAPTVTFNQLVVPSSIVFTLKNASGVSVGATVGYNAATSTATLTPSVPLAYGTTYTATVSGARNSSGVVMTSPFTWTFTTDVAAPTVARTSPANGATGVAISTGVTATFTEAVQAGSIVFTLKNASGVSVGATVSYNAATFTATLTPSVALANGTTYTATVSGALDAVGDPMPAPFTWSFTTASLSSSASIWSSTAQPANRSDSDSNSVEVGVKFYSDTDGSITALRFYKGSGNTGTHVADFWTSTGTLLATATFTSETATGWQQVNFASPVPIKAGTTYVASYHTNAGHYADDQNYFKTQYNSGNLHVPANGGVYAYGPAGSFPTQVWNASNYWVDIVFSKNSTGALLPSSVLAATGPQVSQVVGITSALSYSATTTPLPSAPLISSLSSNNNGMDALSASSASLAHDNLSQVLPESLLEMLARDLLESKRKAKILSWQVEGLL